MFGGHPNPGHHRALVAPRIREPVGTPHAVRDDDWLEQLRASGTPTLLIRGAQDKLLEPDWTSNIATGLACCGVQELDCKHAPNIDRVEPLLDIVLPFLQSHE